MEVCLGLAQLGRQVYELRVGPVQNIGDSFGFRFQVFDKLVQTVSTALLP